MTQPIDKNSCGRLPENIALHNGSSPFAVIEPEPLSQKPLSLQEIRFGNRLPPEGPLYLSSLDHRSCVYRVRPLEDGEDSFSPDHFTDSRFWREMQPYFGIPTELRTDHPGQQIQGVLYDSQRDYFYTPELGSAKWYLIGDAGNYLDFLTSITQFSGYLSDLWEKEPLALIGRSLQSLLILPSGEGNRSSLTAFSKKEASREIDKFLNWLKKFDPSLWKKTARKIRFSEEMTGSTFLQNIFCSNDPQNSPYAFFDPEWGEIHFLPRAIDLLKKGRYEAAVQILVHEGAHQRVTQSGMVMPSHEMLHHSISHFLGKIDPIHSWKNSLAHLFQEVLHVAIQCTFHSPEEEAQAHAQDFSYAVRKLSNEGSRETSLISLDRIDDSWKHAQEYFPPSWLRLSAQYFALAQDIQKPFMEPKLRSFLFSLFKDDLETRLACAYQDSQHCESPSKSMKELRGMIEVPNHK